MRKKVLIALAIAAVSLPVPAGFPFFAASSQKSPVRQLTVTTPVQYQVFQRTAAVGNILVTGTITGNAASLEARFNGGAWMLIATNTIGAFSGTVSNQPQGQGLLEVKVAGSGSVTSVADVGIGDVFIIAGQSNPSGRGTSNQTYTNATIKATAFKNNYLWGELTDPTDSDSGQIDTVSSDSIAAGSLWPILATIYLSDQGVPIAFVPCAKGGTSITSWLPGVDHQDRATLYGSMVYRAGQVGDVKAVLWWQGETDALASMAQATYNGHLDTLADAIQADLGVKLMACKLQTCSGIPDVDEARINAAIAEAWGDNVNVLEGPDLTVLTTTPEDTLHLITTAKLESAAALWWAKLEAAFY